MPVASPQKKQRNEIASSEVIVQPPVSVVDSLPIKLVMLLAAPYMAGKSANEALARAHKLYKQSRFASTIDILGEDARIEEDCEESLSNYKGLIDLIAANPISCSNPLSQITVSFKPSMFSTFSPADKSAQANAALDRAYSRIENLVSYAKEKKLRVTLEAEDHSWTDFHLETYFALINKGYVNCGTVLQSRLFRTKEDLRRFDERMRVRMVIGIYNEPAQIAMTQKPEMKKAAIEFSRELLCRGVYLELASHDTDCMKDFVEEAVLAARVGADKFEFQHLLGVPRKEIQEAMASGKFFAQLAEGKTGYKLDQLCELARSGALMRMYLPYGSENVAGPYCKRRLKANPNMIGYGIKNLLHIK